MTSRNCVVYVIIHERRVSACVYRVVTAHYRHSLDDAATCRQTASINHVSIALHARCGHCWRFLPVKKWDLLLGQANCGKKGSVI